ncbi:MAG: hypothetical protein C5B59_02735 [Bacteroidetes bacterium]|nr:MAG: hypothetical protein C5B59_02735 [Bacteroidota bacterium]
MKRILFFIISVAFTSGIFAQSNKQVQWTYTAKKVAENTFDVHMTASINSDFHLYAQEPGGDGPIPTSFTFTKNPLLILDGKPREVGNVVKKYEQAWNHDVKYYEKNVDFVQRVKLKGNAKTNLAGKVEFMVCNDQKCLPPSNVEIKVNIGG